jgi:hypothetical protein
MAGMFGTPEIIEEWEDSDKTFDDYRILWDGKLKIMGLKGVSFHINCHYRYDNNSKNTNYFEISNGLGIQF